MAIFMRIPGIDGDATDKNHGKWINIDQLSHSFDVATRPSASRTRRGATSASAFDLSKRTDRATVKLHEAILTGKVFPTITIDVTRQFGEGTFVVLQYELTNCSVTSFSTQAFDENAVDAFALSFEQIKTTYTPRDERGKELSEIDFGFNIATNVAI